MLLNEFFYYKDNKDSLGIDRRYDNSKDSSVLEKSDTRKLRLTLGQINQLRMQSEAHEFEEESELEFIKQMYATPVETAES
jgi:hypothetical protein